MQYLTYISDNGITVQINRYPFFSSSSDLNTVGATFEDVQPDGMDGVITTGEAYNQKTLSITGNIIGRSKGEVEQHMNTLGLAMNIHYSGWLYAKGYDGKTKKLHCRPSGTPDFGDMKGLQIPYMIQFRADYPHWVEATETIERLGHVKATFQFPFCAPAVFGMSVKQETIVNNTPFTIEPVIEIASVMSDVKIANLTTGETLELEQDVPEGKRLIINNAECTIELIDNATSERVDATNALIAGKEFLKLIPGENVLELQNAISTGAAIVYIKYNRPKGAV